MSTPTAVPVPFARRADRALADKRTRAALARGTGITVESRAPRLP